jgi:hypothetical protein
MTLDRVEKRETSGGESGEEIPGILGARIRASALRFLPPSARDIVFIFLLWSLFAGTLSNRPLADPDIGWHIRTGEQILATHTLPRVDPYSSTMRGQPWFAWEWLYDLALGILHRACGLNGVVWLCAVLVASTFTLLLSQLLKRGTGVLLAVALMLLAEAAATVHLFARPHIVSWLFVLLWFVALERWEGYEQGNAPRWLLLFFPASTLLWVNLHGEWIFGFGLLAIYTLASFAEGLRARDAFAAIVARHRARAMAWTGAVSAAATFVNPFGWRLHEHIYLYLSDRYLMNRIEEFRSPAFHGWAQRCLGIILLLTLGVLAGHRRRVRLSHLLVVLLAVYAGLLSSRNLPVSSILLVLVIGPLLWASFASLANRPGAWRWMRVRVERTVDFSNRMGSQELQLQGHLWPVVFAAGTLAVCLQGGWLGSRQLIHAGFDAKRVPAAAVDYLEKEPSAEPVFSSDSWGGYLIYRLYPRRLVVIDDRHDLYGSDRFREILTLMQGEPGWRNVLEEWQIRTVVLPTGSTLSILLRDLPGEWRVAYEDKVAVVMERR